MAAMRGSWRVGQVAGIAIYIHWTFLILIAFIMFMHLGQGETLAAALVGLGFVLAIFGCVVLHELGHALTARYYGIQTRDITLLPIGGVARLERMPDVPTQELWVALAGPAVNGVIAAILLVAALILDLPLQYPVTATSGSFVGNLMWANVILGVFNLLPAFPMDGGRVLRALLAQRMEYVRATTIAANVGQVMAVLMAIVGLFVWGNVLVLLVALFVYVGAQEEAHAVQVRSALKGIPVREAMVTRYRTLSEDDTLDAAVHELLAGCQQEFPVVDQQGRLAGFLTRADLAKALAGDGRHKRIGEVMQRDYRTAKDTELVEAALPRLREANQSAMPVMRDGQLVGLLTLENIGELVMVQTALSQGRVADEAKHPEDVR
jgi:Zn-dependent protease/CBS domain-containing protein